MTIKVCYECKGIEQKTRWVSYSSIAVMEHHDQNQEFTLACGSRGPGGCKWQEMHGRSRKMSDHILTLHRKQRP